MIPNIHIHEKLMLDRHQEVLRQMEQQRMVKGVLRQMEQQRMVKGVPRQHFSLPRQFAGKIGALLIALGTSLKQLEPVREPVV